MQVNLFFD